MPSKEKPPKDTSPEETATEATPPQEIVATENQVIEHPPQDAPPPQQTTPVVQTFVPLRFSQKDILLILLTILIVSLIGYLFGGGKTFNEPRIITVYGKSSKNLHAERANITATIATVGVNRVRVTEITKSKVQRIKSELALLGLSTNNITDTYSSTWSDIEDALPSGVVPTICTGFGCTPTPTPIPGTGGSANARLEIIVGESSINKMDQIMDILIKDGAEPYETYEFKDKEKYEAEIKNKALEDAKAQADKIATINNAKVKKIISVKDTASTSNTDTALASGSTSNLSSTITLSASYEVSYEIGSSAFPF